MPELSRRIRFKSGTILMRKEKFTISPKDKCIFELEQRTLSTPFLPVQERLETAKEENEERSRRAISENEEQVAQMIQDNEAEVIEMEIYCEMFVCVRWLA